MTPSSLLGVKKSMMFETMGRLEALEKNSPITPAFAVAAEKVETERKARRRLWRPLAP